MARTALVAYLMLVGWLLFWPGAPGPPESGHLDKAGHLVAGFGLGLLVWASVGGNRLAWVVGAGIVFAVLTEGIQAFIPERNSDALDGLADLAGTALALGVLLLARRRRAPS